MRKLRFVFVSLLMLCGVNLSAQNTIFEAYTEDIDIIVAKDGSGNYTSVTEAINNVPNNSSERTVMFIKNGVYEEKIIVSSSKKNLVMIGEDVDSTIITYGDYAEIVGGTFNTATFRVNADNFWAMNITFNNSAGIVPNVDGTQALAIYTDGDKQVFLHCRFEGWQDTYYTSSNLRNYTKDCFIEGSVDFIFGQTVNVFDSCQIHNVRPLGGYLTAASTEEGYKFGYVFRNCNLTGVPETSKTSVYLGRPWKNHPKTVFMNSYQSSVIEQAGWRTWGGTENDALYAEYNNSGPGYLPEQRVGWSKILTDQEAAVYTLENIYSTNTSSNIPDNWLPEVDNDSLYQTLKAYTVPFMDSTNYDAGVAEVKFQGDNALTFDPDIYSYKIDLKPGTTEVPELIVVAENPRATVDIEYPETIPGVTSVTVTAYDRSTVSEYDIYNSVEGAYDNALLDSVYIKSIKVEDFDPNTFEYDFVLPVGSSKYFAVKPYLAVDDATYRIQKVTSLPGVCTITVTSYSGNETNVYTFNITVSTGVEDALLPFDMSVKYLDGLVLCDVNSKENTTLTIKLFDIKGQEMFFHTTEITAGDNNISIPVTLPSGVYLYKAYTNEYGAEGKFVKK